ncbi:hypothetical protein E2C01_026312 [Portunus trituberculatus]|uniref:Uncharacterized protein n=1 Tax=Portunus trituberculatus TaxID=210409 RepID=A0A5B7EKL0_PORTR|nr:hypothetical protein [Portunus trituberculatus]
MKSLLLDFFGWPLVVAMLQTLIIIIAGFYNFTRINYRFIQLLSMTLCGFLTLILFSGVGENFKNKASEQYPIDYFSFTAGDESGILASVDLLRDYSALSPHLPLKTQVRKRRVEERWQLPSWRHVFS